jgi:hypothetical protein
MILIAAAAAGCAGGRGRGAIVATALIGLALSLPDTVSLVRSNIAGEPNPGGDVFARTPELWAAVRRHAAPDARVANNPLFLSALTAWPANISWASLANRGSCFAGAELAIAFAPLSPARRDAIEAQFVRVFGGEGSAADVREMAEHLWLRDGRRRAAGQGLGERPVRREPRIPPGGKPRRPLADLCVVEVTTQIPANQFSPCRLQNVSVKVLVISMAFIHLGFL